MATSDASRWSKPVTVAARALILRARALILRARALSLRARAPVLDTRALGLGVLLACAAAPSDGHHAFSAEFDAEAPVLLQGKVTRIEWINPHAWVHIESRNEDGSTDAWMVEGGTPNTLMRRGITKSTLQPGTEIIVRGYQSKDKTCAPACKANGRDITLPDGQKVFMGSSGTGAPRDGADPTEPRR